jgi:hypothetical protein
MWKKEEIKKSLKEDEAYNQPPVSDEFPPRYEYDLYGNITFLTMEQRTFQNVNNLFE